MVLSTGTTAATSGGPVTSGGTPAAAATNGASADSATTQAGTTTTGGTPASAVGSSTSTGGATSSGTTGDTTASATSDGAATSVTTDGTSTTGSGGSSTDGSGGTATATTGETPGGIPKFIGNIAPKNQDVPADFADKWMQMSMEANSKWGFVQPSSPDEWVWEPVDEAYQYAKDNGIIFKQHNFFWNFEQPSWVTNDNVAMYAPIWVQKFCERYPDIPMIDVVNEPIFNAAPYRNGLGGAGASGYDWVIEAFTLAKTYCPKSILIINEFNIIEWEDDHNTFVEALHKIMDGGAPIDVIGAQGHDIYRAGTDVSKGYIDHLTEEFGLPIYVTELDIDLADDAEQLAKMQEIIPMLWDHPNVFGITYWGFLQGSTWRTNAWLVNSSGTVRPAMTWLQDFIAAHR